MAENDLAQAAQGYLEPCVVVVYADRQGRAPMAALTPVQVYVRDHLRGMLVNSKDPSVTNAEDRLAARIASKTAEKSGLSLLFVGVGGCVSGDLINITDVQRRRELLEAADDTAGVGVWGYPWIAETLADTDGGGADIRTLPLLSTSSGPAASVQLRALPRLWAKCLLHSYTKPTQKLVQQLKDQKRQFDKLKAAMNAAHDAAVVATRNYDSTAAIYTDAYINAVKVISDAGKGLNK